MRSADVQQSQFKISIYILRLIGLNASTQVNVAYAINLKTFPDLLFIKYSGYKILLKSCQITRENQHFARTYCRNSHVISIIVFTILLNESFEKSE